MLDFSLIDHLNIDFKEMFEDYFDEDRFGEDFDVTEVLFSGILQVLYARAHLCSLTRGYFCKKAKESKSIDEAFNYYREAIDLIQIDFEMSESEFGYYANYKMMEMVQILKDCYNYCLDKVSASIDQRLNADAEGKKSRDLLVELIQEIRTKIEAKCQTTQDNT